MGDSERDGVVDASTGEAFGCKGLNVIDGSILPTSVGPNPSLTIAGLAGDLCRKIPASRLRSSGTP